MSIEFLARDDRNRLTPYKYDHDACTNKKNHRKTDPVEVSVSFKKGLAKVSCLPRNAEFTIKFEPGDDRAEVGRVEELGGYLEAFNAKDLSIGGTTVGTFGTGSGGVPEVRLCLSSEGTKDDECATWGYQWETGSIIGNVGDQRGHKLHIDPETDEHDADTASTSTGSGGTYKFDELRDGVYEIMAYSTRTYRIRGDSVKEVVVYHDETTDDKDTLTKYVGTAGQDTARWSTQRLGLKLMGYIGNDVNRDSKFRGDEAVAGITVRLSGGGLSMSATTNERGFYSFSNVPAGSYTITPSTSTYLVNRGYLTISGRRIARTNHRASAQEYPSLTERDFRLPYWSSYTSRSLSNSTSRVCDDRTPPKCATLYNFGLLYKDGAVEGAVNNLSGSASGIDLTWTDVFTDNEQEVTTNFRGEFTRTRLTEGDFTVKLEDAGWAVPMMRAGKPDDDGTTPAPSTVRASLRGKDDFETMGMLHVYDAGKSSGDAAGASVRVRGRTQGTNAASFDTAVSWKTGWSRAPSTEKTEGGNIGTISWKSKSVSFSFGFRNSALSDDASVEVKLGSRVCASHRCDLAYNRTGSSDSTEVKENTITVMVTAENGYDDHEYTVNVGRAAPIGRYIENTDIRVLKSDGTDSTVTARGDGPGTSLSTAWTVETRTSSTRSVNVRIDLTSLGDPDEDNAYCAQSVKVTEYNDTATVKAMDAHEDDICANMRYSLSAATQGTLYAIHLNSEDDVGETYYLEVNRAGPRLSDDAALKSLVADPGNMTPAFDSATTEYRVNVTHDIEDVTFTWAVNDSEATAEADPEDEDDGTAGHQLELGEKGTQTELTITVTAEDETERVYTVTVHRPEEPVTDDATLSNLTIDEGSLEPAFDPDETEYTVNVPHTVEEVTIEWDEAHEAATSEADPADADTVTDGHQVDLGDKGDASTLTITVTAADGSTTEDYTVTVTRLFNDDATLSELTVDPGVLDPDFDPADTLYATSVEHDVEEVTVTWELNDTNGSVETNRSDADASTDGHQLTLLGEGDTTRLTITVTAENGDSTQVYYLNVARAEGPPSDDATLDDLAVTGQTITPSFRPDRTSYSVSVTHDVDTVTVTFTKSDNGATTDPEDSPHKFALNDAGEETELEVTVTAEDETTTETYTITVTRATAPGIVTMRGGSAVSGFAIDEGDTAIYQVRLATAPTEDVTVTVAAAADGGITIATGGTLTFTATDWETAQNVEISSTADDDADQEDPVEITHTAQSQDLVYEALVDTLAVTLTETDTRGVTVSSTGIEFAEGESNTYTVVLNSQPTCDVVLSIGGTRHDVTVNEGSSDLLTFTTADWNTAQNVAVAKAQNTDTANYSAFNLTHRAVGADYDGIPVDDVRVKVMDDESPAIVVTRTAWSMDEETAETYNIMLTQAPSSGETVTVRLIYSSADFSVAYAGGGTAAVLTSDNWNTGVNVTVTAVDVDADVTKTLTHTVTVEDTDTEEGSETVYTGSPSASGLRITVKDIPDDS